MGEAQEQDPFERNYRALLTALKNGAEQRESAEIAAATTALRKLAARLTPELYARTAGASDFNRRLQEAAELPVPVNEDELALTILFALALFQRSDWAGCRRLLHQLLLAGPNELCLQAHCEPLANYLLHKYLICVERGENLADDCDDLFFLLKRLELARAEPLYATLLVFLVRWLLRQRQFARLSPLLRLTELPRRGGAVAQAKFMFYRGFFASTTGQFAQARECMERALRRPPAQPDTRGYRCFRLLATKQLVVLELMLSRPIAPAQLQAPGLRLYRQLVALVTRGENRQFEALIAAHAAEFDRDLVAPVLRRMRGVVLQNALKKIAAAYTSISAAEVLRRLGIEPASGFDLLAFVARSREVVERFSYDPARDVLRFERAAESFDDPALQGTVHARLTRLERLNEHIQRSLKYAPREQDAGERPEPEEQLEEVDLDALDFDDVEFDD